MLDPDEQAVISKAAGLAGAVVGGIEENADGGLDVDVASSVIDSLNRSDLETTCLMLAVAVFEYANGRLSG